MEDKGKYKITNSKTSRGPYDYSNPINGKNAPISGYPNLSQFMEKEEYDRNLSLDILKDPLMIKGKSYETYDVNERLPDRLGERKFTYNPHLKMNVEKESSDKFTMNLEEIEPGVFESGDIRVTNLITGSYIDLQDDNGKSKFEKMNETYDTRSCTKRKKKNHTK